MSPRPLALLSQSMQHQYYYTFCCMLWLSAAQRMTDALDLWDDQPRVLAAAVGSQQHAEGKPVDAEPHSAAVRNSVDLGERAVDHLQQHGRGRRRACVLRSPRITPGVYRSSC